MNNYIVVYFANSCSAKFDKKDVVFITDETTLPDTLSNYLNSGKTVINWHNVCFLRDVPDTTYVGLTN